MGKRSGFATILLATSVAFAAPGAFTTKDGLVSFRAPLPPKETVSFIPGALDHKYRQTTYAMNAANYLMLGSVLELVGPPTTGDEDSFLSPMFENLSQKFGSDFVLDDDGKTELRLGANRLKGMRIKGTIGAVRFVLRVKDPPASSKVCRLK